MNSSQKVPTVRRFGVFSNVNLNKLLNKQSNDQKLKTSWRSCDVTVMYWYNVHTIELSSSCWYFFTGSVEVLKSTAFDASNGSPTRYVKLRIAHAPGMPGSFSPPPTSKDTASWRSQHASRHVRYARAVMHVGIANPRWRGKRSRHSWRMHNPQFYVSGKRPMTVKQSVWQHFYFATWLMCHS